MEKALTFPKKSYTFTDSYIKNQFLPTMGYVAQSDTFKAIANRTLGMTVDRNIVPQAAIFGGSMETSKPFNYVAEIIAKHMERNFLIVRTHDVYNIMNNKVDNVDKFICSLMLFKNPKWYTQASNSVRRNPHHYNDIVFQKSPFQQFMFIDTLISILLCSDVTEYADLVLMETKYSIGIPSLTLAQCYRLFKTFNKKLVTHIIPRRHGKTIFTILLIALSLIFFPSAQLKMSYIAHTKHLTDSAYKTVKDIVVRLCPIFNETQKMLYESQHGNIDYPSMANKNRDDNDFYYKCAIQSKHGTTISCIFHKLSRKNKCIDSNCGHHQNEIQCVSYRTKGVSK